MLSKSTNDDLPKQTASHDPSKQRRSVLHAGVAIKGNWHSDGIVEFGGKIKGNLTVDVLIVSSTGDVKGNVRSRSVTIEGHFNGTIAAIDVTLASTAVMTGEVMAEKIQIDFGASVEGRLQATGKTGASADIQAIGKTDASAPIQATAKTDASTPNISV